MKKRLKSYKELKVWQKAVQLSINIFRVTKEFPKSELYGLTTQMRRCAIAIASNIAEGACRGHLAEYIQFLRISFASGGELETQLIIAKEVGLLEEETFNQINSQLSEIMRMLNGLISKLKRKKGGT